MEPKTYHYKSQKYFISESKEVYDEDGYLLFDIPTYVPEANEFHFIACLLDTQEKSFAQGKNAKTIEIKQVLGIE